MMTDEITAIIPLTQPVSRLFINSINSILSIIEKNEGSTTDAIYFSMKHSLRFEACYGMASHLRFRILSVLAPD